MSEFDRDSYAREKLRELRPRLRMLEAEQRRLYRLLALSLRVATRDARDCDPLQLLELLGAVDGSRLDRPAWLEEADRERSKGDLDRLVRLLRDTDPARLRAATRAA